MWLMQHHRHLDTRKPHINLFNCNQSLPSEDKVLLNFVQSMFSVTNFLKLADEEIKNFSVRQITYIING